MGFAKRLKGLREQKGLEREDLAKSLDLTYWAIAKYESGGRTPDLDTISKIAQFFNVSVDYLLGRTDDSRTPDQVAEEAMKYKIGAFAREDDPLADLPGPARRSVEDFIEYVRVKYKKED